MFGSCILYLIYMNIIQNRKIYFIISGFLFTASIAAMLIFGFKLGIDFTGGSLMAIKVSDNIETNATAIQEILTKGEKSLLESVAIQPAGERGFLLRFKAVTEDEHQAVLGALRLALAPKDTATTSEATAGKAEVKSNPLPGIKAVNNKGEPVDIKFEANPAITAESGTTTIGGSEIVMEDSFESIGPTVGRELQERSIYALLAVMIAIIIYIAWAFRKVSQPVASWKYGVVAVIALLHDVIVPAGVFAVLGHYGGVEIDILFVTALLTILGFSVHDTIVVFDRTRENLARGHRFSPPARGGDKEGVGGFEEVVNASVNQTIRRSINTSATAFLALLAMYLFGGEPIKHFVLALMIGIAIGTYSSIFIASPLLVVWNNWKQRR